MNRFCVALLYGRTGRLTAKNGGFWPGQKQAGSFKYVLGSDQISEIQGWRMALATRGGEVAIEADAAERVSVDVDKVCHGTWDLKPLARSGVVLSRFSKVSRQVELVSVDATQAQLDRQLSPGVDAVEPPLGNLAEVRRGPRVLSGLDGGCMTEGDARAPGGDWGGRHRQKEVRRAALARQ